MEALSDIIHLFKMNVSVFHNAQSCGNWHMDATHIGSTCFHMVTKGECELEIPGEFQTILHHGDMVIFPREIPHSMRPVGDVAGIQEIISLDKAEHIDGTGMLCAEAVFNHKGSFYILDALPRVFIIRYNDDNEWSGALIKLIMAESVKPNVASPHILDRLSELLFMYALRQYLLETDQNTGMLALYADTRLQKAVAAIHDDPAVDWTLEKLASLSSMSRTSFAEAFRKASGWTPAKYILWWRMQLAWSLLSEGAISIIVADRVGYKSEAAFSRAFKKHFGIAAGKVRQGIDI